VEGLRQRDGGFDVLGQAAVAVDPGKEQRDHSPASVEGEAYLALRLAHDFDSDRACRRGTRPLNSPHRRRQAAQTASLGAKPDGAFAAGLPQRIVAGRQESSAGVADAIPAMASQQECTSKVDHECSGTGDCGSSGHHLNPKFTRATQDTLYHGISRLSAQSVPWAR